MRSFLLEEEDPFRWHINAESFEAWLREAEMCEIARLEKEIEGFLAQASQLESSIHGLPEPQRPAAWDRLGTILATIAGLTRRLAALKR